MQIRLTIVAIVKFTASEKPIGNIKRFGQRVFTFLMQKLKKVPFISTLSAHWFHLSSDECNYLNQILYGLLSLHCVLVADILFFTPPH